VGSEIGRSCASGRPSAVAGEAGDAESQADGFVAWSLRRARLPRAGFLVGETDGAVSAVDMAAALSMSGFNMTCTRVGAHG